MSLPERVLVDTSAFYALISASDNFHLQARRAYENLIDREQELWTTSYVLVELTTLVHRRLGFQTLQTLMKSVHGVIQIFWIESSIHGEAWKQIETSQGIGLGFVDWTTALAARRLRAHIFTFDLGFSQQGLPIIPR